MDRMRGWWKRVAAFLRPGRVDADLEEEVAFHLAMEEQQLRARGMSPGAARRAARLAFGGVDRFKEGVRDVRGFRWLDDLGRDLRDAFRTFRRAPGFTLIAVLTLGLGIGSAVTVFSVVSAVMVRPVAFPDPERLVHVWETTPEGGDFTTSEPNFLDFSRRNRTFEALGAYRIDHRSLTGRGEPERLSVMAASRSLLAALRIEPALGRTFAADEDRFDGDTRVTMLGHAFWVRAFGADSGVVGTSVVLDGSRYTVVGVAPAGFSLVPADLWVPLAPNPAGDRGNHWLDMIGRLRPRTTLEQATADLARVSAEIGRVDAEVAGWSVRMVGLTDWVVGPKFRQTGRLLLGAVAFLLLMTCATVATLLLARSLARRTDLGVRVALGAGRRRVMRQLFVESLVLALLGTGLGLLGAAGAIAALRALGPGLVPRLAEVQIDGRVLGFSLALTVATSLLFGLLPAVQATRLDIRDALGGARTGPSRGHRRIHEGLVTVQVALAVLLLAGAGLMVRSLVRLHAVDPGFGTDHVWSVPLSLPDTRYPTARLASEAYDRLIDRLSAIPRVTAVGGTSVTPFGDLNLVNDVTPEDRVATLNGRSGFLQAAWRIVTTDYFRAAGIPLVAGRTFTAADRWDQPGVAVITRSLAERLWPDRDPIGRRFYWGGTTGELRTVIGVVGDIRDFDLEVAPPPVLFLTADQVIWPSLTLLVRESGSADLAAPIRRAVWSVDADLPVPDVERVAARRSAAMAEPRFGTVLVGAFATLALVLAAVGLYGVLAFAVVRRNREIGVRLALGARPRAVMRMLVGRGMAVIAVGIALGVAGALALTRFMGGLLHDTAPTDVGTYLVVVAVFGAVALLAAWIPARRAMAVDPVEALRRGE